MVFFINCPYVDRCRAPNDHYYKGHQILRVVDGSGSADDGNVGGDAIGNESGNKKNENEDV